MSYYSDLRKKDVIHWLRPLLDSGVYKARLSDGKFTLSDLSEPTESPWHYIEPANNARCVYLHNHLFSKISPRTPIGRFIPRRCHECWKIVIRPKTLKQLFALEKLLVNLGWPSKCGIERRSHTPLSKYRYGGYIYSTSQNEAGLRLIELRKILSGSKQLKDVECYLKRACTEMELAFPDSTTWTISDEQSAIEDRLDWLVVHDVPTNKTASHILDGVHIRWIQWAAENGDETYLDYTDGVPMYRPAVRYEPSVEGADEATPDDETVSVGDSSTAVPKENTRRKMKGKKK